MAYQNLKLTTMAALRHPRNKGKPLHTCETIYKIKSLGSQASEKNAMRQQWGKWNSYGGGEDKFSAFPFPLGRLESCYCAAVR